CIYDLRRSDIIRLRDDLADEHGACLSRLVLACLSKACAWKALEDENFYSPFVRGLVQKPEKERDRALSDEEIRDLWRVLDSIEPPCVAPMVKAMLLTGARVSEIAKIHRRELQGDTWILPSARSKNAIEHTLPLPATVMALLGYGKGYLFSADGGR